MAQKKNPRKLFNLFLLFMVFSSNFLLVNNLNVFYSNTYFDLEEPKNHQGILEINIVPKPQYAFAKDHTLLLDNNWTIALDNSNLQYNFSVNWFKANMSGVVNFTAINGSLEYPKTKTIILGNPTQHDFVKDALERRKRILPNILGDEGYIIETFNDDIEEVIIAAHTPNGIFYAIQTLIQLLNHTHSLNGCQIIDYPEHDIRGAYEYEIALNWNGTAYDFNQGHKDYIDWLVSLKYNTICLQENGVFFRQDDQWKYSYDRLFSYCRERFIEPIPRLCSISTVSPFDFEYVEGWYIENESFTFNNTDYAEADTPFEDLLQNYNGDFENDIEPDGVPDNWSITNKSGATWTWDNSESYSGSHSMRLDVPTSTSESAGAYLTLTLYGVVPNSCYLIHAWAKADNIVGTKPQLTFYTRNPSGDVGQLVSETTETTDWKEFGMVLKTNDDEDRLTIYSRIMTGGSGTFWLDDVKLYRINGALKNVIRSTDTDIVVTNLSKTETYIEGVDYEITNGTTNLKFQDTLTSFQIKRNTSGSIDFGETVLVNYDTYVYSRLSKYWISAPCVAKEELYTKYIYPGVDKLMDYYHPKIINIDADEIRGFYRDSRSISRFKSNAEAIAYYLNRVNDYIVSKDPNCRVWIWDDMVSPYHNGGVESYQTSYGGLPGRMAESTENEWIDKNIIMDIWWYETYRTSQMAASIDFFKEKGYEIMGSPCDSYENIIDWSELLLNQPHSLGGIITHWDSSTSVPSFTTFADNFWNTRYKLKLFDSFEKDEDKDNFPDNWNKTGTPKYSNDGSSQHGSRYADFPNCSICVTGTTDTAQSELISINPNCEYILSAYIRRNKTGTENATLILQWFDSVNELISENFQSYNVSNENNYEYFEMKVTSPSNATYAMISLEGETDGTESFWFDIIRLKEETLFFGITYADEIPDEVLEKTYSFRFDATGGLLPYIWSIDSGNFPLGMNIDSNSGTIAGVPKKPGTYNFTVKVADSSGKIDLMEIVFYANVKYTFWESIPSIVKFTAFVILSWILLGVIIILKKKRK